MASSTSLGFSVIFALFSLLSLASSSNEENNIPVTLTIPLTSTFSSKPSMEKPSVFLPHLTSSTAASLSRAHHSKSKHGKNSHPYKTPLFPRRYGFHAIFLSFGTPPQKLSFLVDTGGSAVEAPCTGNYTCKNCSSSSADPKKLPIFYPDRSSSSKILECRHSKCARTFPHLHFRCPNCTGNSKNCSNACPTYILQYATGESRGYFLLENLNFPGKIIRNIQFGCTVAAAREATVTALAGFDRSVMSLPVQLGVKKFAYCLKSHKYDGTRNSGKLILDYSGGETKGLSHGPFLKNPRQYPNYYYLGVKDIKLGNKLLRIPSKYLSPGSDGKNGVIIDSGYGGAGYMREPVFKILTDELKKRLSQYRRSVEAETHTRFSLCYNFTGHKSIKIPDLTYQFTGGAKMVVSGENYFEFIREVSIACLDMLTDTTKSLEFTSGPSIILGNSPQVDHYVEYDLKNQRLGFRPQAC